MQILFWEDAWKRTISKQDEEQIEAIFHTTQIDQGISFTYLWEAQNHRDDTLVTTIIHNGTNAVLPLTEVAIQFNSMVEKFTVPVEIPAYHSMPWTFIFQKDSKIDQSMDATFIIKTR